MNQQPQGIGLLIKYALLVSGIAASVFALNSKTGSGRNLESTHAESSRVIELAAQIRTLQPSSRALMQDVAPESPDHITASLSEAGLTPANLVRVTPERSTQRQSELRQSRRTRIELADASIEQLVRFAIALENADHFAECVAFELNSTQNSLLWNAAITYTRPVSNQTSRASN